MALQSPSGRLLTFINLRPPDGAAQPDIRERWPLRVPADVSSLLTSAWNGIPVFS